MALQCPSVTVNICYVLQNTLEVKFAYFIIKYYFLFGLSVPSSGKTKYKRKHAQKHYSLEFLANARRIHNIKFYVCHLNVE
jgi:hypothetical protein